METSGVYVQGTRVTYKSVSCLHKFLASHCGSPTRHMLLIGSVLVSITLIYVCLILCSSVIVRYIIH